MNELMAVGATLERGGEMGKVIEDMIRVPMYQQLREGSNPRGVYSADFPRGTILLPCADALVPPSAFFATTDV